MTIIHIPCDAETRNELSSMVYKRWTLAYDNLSAVKTLTWEATNSLYPKNEWRLYHNSALKSAERELHLAQKLKEAICQYSPLILGE
jgi:hypothetical protein